LTVDDDDIWKVLRLHQSRGMRLYAEVFQRVVDPSAALEALLDG